MFKCHDCGHIFDEPNRVDESRGEFWGIPCTEAMYYCPYCSSENYEEYKEDEENEESN